MINFFNSVIDFLEMLGHLVTYLITGIAQLLAMIPAAFAMLTYSIGYLPSMLLAFAAVAITISIVFLIIGR